MIYLELRVRVEEGSLIFVYCRKLSVAGGVGVVKRLFEYVPLRGFSACSKFIFSCI